MSGSFRLDWQLAVRDDPDLPSMSKLLALVLATHMGEAGSCFPGVELIAKEMGVHERTVQRQLRGPLIERGYLEIAPGGGQGRANRYQATLPTPAQRHPSDPANPGAVSQKGGTESANPGTVPPEPVINSSENPSKANAAASRTAHPDGLILQAWEALVETLPNANGQTLAALTRDYPDLQASEIEWAHQQLLAQLDTHPGGIRHPTAYVRRILTDTTRFGEDAA